MRQRIAIIEITAKTKRKQNKTSNDSSEWGKTRNRSARFHHFEHCLRSVQREKIDSVVTLQEGKLLSFAYFAKITLEVAGHVTIESRVVD